MTKWQWLIEEANLDALNSNKQPNTTQILHDGLSLMCISPVIITNEDITYNKMLTVQLFHCDSMEVVPRVWWLLIFTRIFCPALWFLHYKIKWKSKNKDLSFCG